MSGGTYALVCLAKEGVQGKSNAAGTRLLGRRPTPLVARSLLPLLALTARFLSGFKAANTFNL